MQETIVTISGITDGKTVDKVTVNESEIARSIIGMLDRGITQFEIVEGDDGASADD